ncbi:hypothetical protein LTR93_011201 [Exophiala xenobiotica]|nr:hypothetical protein LTR93_011201 [Exophiala xenobiotica]
MANAAHMDVRRELLPDPEVIARAHDDLGQELRKLQNLPAVNQGRGFLDAMTQQFTALRREMNQNFREMNERFDRLENLNLNAINRTQNSLLSTDRDELFRLVNVTTGQAIPEFPGTPNDLERMTAAHLRSVLIELGAPPDNRRTALDTMKKSLRVQIGLKAERSAP